MGNKLHPNQVREIVDFLFSMPVVNPPESTKGLLASVFFDENGDSHRSSKVDDNNEDEVQKVVKMAFDTWREKNKTLNHNHWYKLKCDMLTQYRTFTNDKGVQRRIDIYINGMKDFVERLEKKSGEKSIAHKYSTNDQRFYALRILCHDFYKSLNKLSKKERGEIISIITNANPEDSYKKIFTDDWFELEEKIDDEFKDKINKFKSVLEK
jgi:hypothetical protein